MIPKINLLSLICLFLSWLDSVQAFNSVAPIWLTSPYMRAGSQDVIATLTGAAVDPIFTFTFSSALPGTPNLAYGIRKYRGTDTLRDQTFEIRKLSLTASSFTVQIDIVGSTWILILNVPYLAVDPTFPHHLNSFDNVPINYGTTLTNITVKSLSPTYFSNTINYTQQTAGRPYTIFPTPLSGNKMLLYITGLSTTATGRDSVYYPINIKVDYDILTTSTYKLSVQVSVNIRVAKLQFSMIVFNYDDVEKSKKYVIIYELWQTTAVGSFKEIPEAFVDNFILGLTDFGTVDGMCVVAYQWEFATVRGKFGVKMNDSVPYNSNYDCALSRIKSTVFYMKTWQCQTDYPYFNLTTNLCQDECGLYTFQNTTVYQCHSCEFGCAQCPNLSQCDSCDQTHDHRTLTNVSGKMTCECMTGYYQDPSNSANTVCVKCNLSNCVSCSGVAVCTQCNGTLLPGYSITASGKCLTCGYGCATCNQTTNKCITCKTGFVLNAALLKCECLSGTYASSTNVSCLACNQKCGACTGPSQTECTNCTSTSTWPYYNDTTKACQKTCGLYFFQNTTAFECQKCTFNCKDCGTSPQCTECDLQTTFRKLITQRGKKVCACIAGYYQNPANATDPVCKKCIDNCITCKDATTCQTCNESYGYMLSTSKQCIQCGFGCNTCDQAAFQCTKCKAQFQFNETTHECACPNGTIKSISSVTCISCHPKCKTCTGTTQYECTSCFSEQNRIEIKQSNGLTQCLCDPFAYTEPEDGGAVCVKKTNESCDYGFIYIKEKKSCIEICGDGKNFGTFECDDGNTVDGDGCSKTCQVEQDFDCKTDSGTETCVYTGVVNIVTAKAFKNPFSNNLLIQCKLQPIKKFFYTINWKAGLVLVGPKMELIDSWMEGEWLQINTTYFEDLSGKTLTIKYSSASSRNKTTNVTTRRLFDSVFDFDITLRDYELPIVPANNIKATYLQEDTYTTVRTVQGSLFIVATCTMVLILAAFTLKTVFPFWQLIQGLQTIFLSLGVINYMNPILAGFTEFSVIKGLRSTKIYFENWVSPNTVLDYNIASLGYVNSFFGNMNIMIFIEIAVLVTAGALFLMSKKDLAMRFPFQFCKRALMLLILYSSMGCVFSIGLISTIYPFQIAVASIAGIILVVQLYNFVTNLRRYYHFEKTFDLTKKKSKYIVVTLIVGRLIQALVISVLRQHTLIAACVILSIQAILAVTMTIARPYTKTPYNLISIISEWTVTGFLAIDLVMNLQSIQSIDTQNLLSLVQIALSCLIVLLMAICFTFSLIKDYCTKDKTLTPLNFDDFQAGKGDSPSNPKFASTNDSKDKFSLQVQDVTQNDNSMLFFNKRNSKHLVIRR